MRFSQAWTVTRHDLALLRKRRSILYTLVILPIGIGVGFPLLVRYILQSSPHIPAATLTALIDAFGFWFVIGGVSLPTAIAAYSIVGEKVEKSLEPLLATPTTDGEILLGKVLAAFVPTMIALWGGAALYMALIDRITAGHLGYLYYPNLEIVLLVFVLAPVTAILAIEVSVAVSSRVADVRTAQQIGGVLFLPFILLYVAVEVNAFPLDPPHVLLLAGILSLAALGLFSVIRKLFAREEILTRWK
jgi:ABC-2 type transport system permease protein